MRRYVLIAMMIAVLVALAGCGGGDSESPSAEPEEESDAIVYRVMEMDANAEAVQPSAEVLEEFVLDAETDGEVEGVDYIDLRVAEPHFVGYEIVASRAGLYLWVAVGDDLAVTDRLLDNGIVVSPGRFFGPGGEGHIRLALVPTLDECEAAADAVTAALA